MIRYTLKCDRDHVFEAWFQSADAYEKLHKASMTSCAICGSTKVEKSLMAPRVQASRGKTEVVETPPETPPVAKSDGSESLSLSEPDSPLAKAISRLRAEVEASSDYVGNEFATQARAMHEGDMPERAIHGEARLEDAKALAEDGVPVLPLPFSTRTKSN